MKLWRQHIQELEKSNIKLILIKKQGVNLFIYIGKIYTKLK